MDILSKEEIEQLAEKQLRGRITVEEQARLQQWVEDRLVGEPAARSGEDEWGETAKRLLARIKSDAGLAPAPRRIKHMPYRWAAVAAVVVATGLGAMLWPRHSDRTPVPVAVAPVPSMPDKPPGQTGAILTLASGKQLILDSAGNGTIARLGHLQLIKKGGILRYQKDQMSPATDDPGAHNTITTPRGRQFALELADGTKVWLNAASSITYPTVFTDNERRVQIKGEAYFEIAAEVDRPFVVIAAGSRIEVLGTDFDVMAYPDEKEVKTTLLEGAVKVIHAGTEVVMHPGEQARFIPQTGGIAVDKIDADQMIQWVSGKLSLNDLDVRTIMRKISRWYDVEVRFEGPVSDERFWGVINREANLSDVLAAMRANGIYARLEGNTVVVTADKPNDLNN